MKIVLCTILQLIALPLNILSSVKICFRSLNNFKFCCNTLLSCRRCLILTTRSRTRPSRTSPSAPRTATTRSATATAPSSPEPSTGSRFEPTPCGTSFPRRTGRNRSRPIRTTLLFWFWLRSSRSSSSSWPSSHCSSSDPG